MMLTQAPSPTRSTSGAEPWPARFAGKRLGVLSHRMEREAACETSSRKKEETGELSACHYMLVSQFGACVETLCHHNVLGAHL